MVNSRPAPSEMLMVSVFLCVVLNVALASDIEEYAYPVKNPFEATVIGTPPLLKYQVSQSTTPRERIYTLDIFPKREVPEVLWHVKKLRFSLAYQHGAAPLIFIIPGTGASYRAPSVRFLTKVLYQAGFHILSLSSPTSFDFVTAGSSTHLPGISAEDARDLYRVMQRACDKIQKHIGITDYYLMGYSLGALNAAFVSHLDEREGAFNFRRVLMLNPPVNLYKSAQIIDELSRADPKIKTANQLFDNLFSKFAEYFKQQGKINIGDDAFLFKFQESQQSLTLAELKVLIGAAFRFSAANMVFSADLLNNSGYVVEKEAVLRVGSSLTPYFTRALWWRFADYFELMLLPYWRTVYPEGSKEELIHQIGLLALADYLKQADKIAVITNADDIILGDGDLEFLRNTFGERLITFPTGGHLGNLEHKSYISRLLELLQD